MHAKWSISLITFQCSNSKFIFFFLRQQSTIIDKCIHTTLSNFNSFATTSFNLKFVSELQTGLPVILRQAQSSSWRPHHCGQPPQVNTWIVVERVALLLIRRGTSASLSPHEGQRKQQLPMPFPIWNPPQDSVRIRHNSTRDARFMYMTFTGGINER